MTRLMTAEAVADRVRTVEDVRRRSDDVNVGTAERWASGAVGGAMAWYGLRSGGWVGAGLALMGGGLIYRAVSGHCEGYAALGIDTSDGGPSSKSSADHRGLRVARSFTIHRTSDECYAFWRNFENLPRFMRHLESVSKLDEAGRTHWVARAPLGQTVSWDAELIDDRPGELIAWRSLENSQIANSGSVRFRPAPGARGTEVSVELNYEPPAGALGAAVAWLSGEEPRHQIREDLRRFKQLLETGEIATTEGQPSCRAIADR